MTNRIEIKKDEDSGEHYIDVYDLADLFEDVDLVESYTLEWKDDGSFSMEFFDKDENRVFPKKA
jgi:hypothetical protein